MGFSSRVIIITTLLFQEEKSGEREAQDQPPLGVGRWNKEEQKKKTYEGEKDDTGASK